MILGLSDERFIHFPVTISDYNFASVLEFEAPSHVGMYLIHIVIRTRTRSLRFYLKLEPSAP